MLYHFAFWYNDYQVTREYKWAERQSIGWGYGVEGLTDVIQWPSNLVQVQLNSVVSDIDFVYEEFMSKFDRIIVVSFGTTFTHSEQDFNNLIKLFSVNP